MTSLRHTFYSNYYSIAYAHSARPELWFAVVLHGRAVAKSIKRLAAKQRVGGNP